MPLSEFAASKKFLYSPAVGEDAVPEKRVTMPVSLTPAARDTVDRIKPEFGVGKQEAVARILEKWAGMSKRVRREFLDEDGDPASVMLDEERAKRLAGGKSEPMTIDEGLAEIKAIAEQLTVVYKHGIQPALDQAADAKKNTSKK